MALRDLVPQKYWFKLVHLKKQFQGGFAKPYYSQSGEDIILSKLLTGKHGFYVDVGAFHPQHYSNTALLYKRGWRGINIDPNPESIALLKMYRRRDINLCVGVSREAKEMDYFIFNQKSCNTFSVAQKEKMEKRKYIKLLETRKIACLPLAQILENNVPLETKIDFMNVDVEGFDIEVLESNDWQKFSPQVIAVEDVDFSVEAPERSRVYQFLKNKGYTIFGFTGMTLILKRDKI